MFINGYLYLICFWRIFILLPPYSDKPSEIRYFQEPTISFDMDNEQTSIIEQTDKASGRVVYQVNTNNHPLYYYSNIKTGVCLDDECRPLDIVLYWNITGRYLGFTLPEDEFLSKYDHEAFTKVEYERLHMLLADSLLPLDNLSYEDLTQEAVNQTDESTEVDGVSGATSQNILDYVVEGAAYTTYTLWNIVYGSTQDLVKHSTIENLTDKLLTAILQSSDIGDKFWALRHIEEAGKLTPALQDEVLECISDANYSLGTSATRALDSTALQSEVLQTQLMDKVYQCKSGLKFLIIKKLQEAPNLSAQVVNLSSQNLHAVNGKLLESILNLYRAHKISDQEAIHRIASLLKEENRFISQKAFEYLNEVEIEDSSVHQQLIDYRLSYEN